MSLRGSNVTLTRSATRNLRRDVRPLAATVRYNSTLALRPIYPVFNLRTRLQNLKQTPQITTQFQRPYSIMSTNNSELQLSQVFDIKDKVALVTGGGSGIGLMITQTLAVNGAKVYIVGRTEEKLEKVAEVHGKDISGQIIPIVGDISTKGGVQKLVKEIESREKCLCILVNNAGIAPDKVETSVDSAEQFKESIFEPATEKEWLDVYQTNVVGPFLTSTAFLPFIAKATEVHKGYSGTIVNISSISGHIKISQGHFAYNTSKGATIHLNKLLASEIAKNGIKVRVNSIAPGVFPSEMTTNESRDDNQKSEMPKKHKEGLPAQRPGKDQDIAAAILFVVACQYLNGQTVTVDGGYAIQVGN